MANVFPADEYIWIPDDDEYMVPAQVVAKFERGSAGQVRRVTVKAKSRKSSSRKSKSRKSFRQSLSKPIRLSAEDSAKCIRMEKESLESIDDMVQLKSLDEASIHYNLKLRYDQDNIYTWVSKILISLNPFKMLPIYDPQVMDDYLAKGSRNLPPHIYGVADDSFRAMQSNKLEEADQSCIVSGESGAGKTEATKLFLQYIAEKSRREMEAKGMTSSGPGDESLQQKVLEANPLMEAFGNAKTVRNDNSSRFGKFINVEFSGAGAILGGSVQNYLLEKSRLVTQGEGERNYHIFYQLCAAAQIDPDLKSKYQLSDASQYYFLNQSKRSAITIDGLDDSDEWQSTRRAMEVIALKDSEVDCIISLLCGILHLGNIQFDAGKSDTCSIKNKDMLDLAASQLSIDPATLGQAITNTLRRVPGQSPIWSGLDAVKAGDARDALAKAIYSVLFDYLIDRINESLAKVSTSAKEIRNIGVLDIFGFEDFEKNSFEQLCINYTNERLQGHFNDHIFKLEMAEYEREGVKLDKFEFKDNSNVIKVIDQGRGQGILSVIDEAIKSGRDVADSVILEKILSMAPTSDGIISEPKMGKKDAHLKNCFVFLHYAGNVAYNVDGFVEKNRDILQRGLYEAGITSKNDLLCKLFKATVDPDAKKKSLGIQFRDQLNVLMDRLQSTEPSFVRCVKPNAEKLPNRFTSHMVLDQLRYAGVLEVCRIRKLGFPVRKEFKQFVLSYRILAKDSASIGNTDAKALCASLEKDGILDPHDYAVGNAKVFMRDQQYEIIETERERVLTDSVIVAQRAVRGFLARMKFHEWQEILTNVSSALKEGKSGPLEKALLAVGDLPFGGRHLPQIQDAQAKLAILREIERVTNLLTAAIESEDLAEIQSALKAADKIKLKDDALLARAHDTEERIIENRKVRAALRDAVDKADKNALREALKLADRQNIGNAVEARDAEALLNRLEEEEHVRSDLEGALKDSNVAKVRECMNRLVSLGVSSDDELIARAEEFVKEQAQWSREHENEKTRLLRELEEAMERRDLTTLLDLEVAVLKIGLEENEIVKQAMVLRQKLESARDKTAALAAEVRSVQHKAQSEDGVHESDLQSLEAALKEAKDTGLDAEMSPAIKDAEGLLERIDNQAKVQAKLVEICKDVESAPAKEKLNVKRRNKDTLIELLAQCQELGIATKEAKKVRYWVGDIQQVEAHENADALASSRQERLEKLREASKDDIEEQSMRRLASLASEAHAARLEASRDDSVYDLKNYYRLRTDEDFTEPLPADERVMAAKHKLWARNKPIPKSLLALSDEQNRTALRVNRAILQYCGEMSTSFPATLAQYILVKGLEDPEMCDEIYMQLCKHIHANPKPESADRAWLLMCMATKTFPPTEQFTNFLLNFLIRHQSLAGLQGNYASLCIVQLDATIELGASFFKPNLEEIQSYRKRPPVLASIKMIKGNIVQYPVSPDLRIGQVLELIRRQNNIEDDPETSVYGIFVKDAKETGKMNPRDRLKRFYKHYNPDKLKHIDLFLEHWAGKEDELFAKLMEKYGPEPEEDDSKKKGFLSASVTGALHAAKMLGLTTNRKPPPAPVSAWPLPWWSHMGDVFLRMTAQGKEPLFEFKRRLFLDNIDEGDELLFWQLLGDIRAGDLVFNEEAHAAEAALLALALQSDKYKLPKPEDLSGALLVENLSPDWRRRKRPEDWARVAVNLGVKMSRNPSKLRQYFVNVCKKSPVYGMTLFAGRQADTPDDITIGVDKDGIHFLQEAPGGKLEITQDFWYRKIYKYGASVEYCWMAYDDGSKKGKSQGANVLVYTLQSWEMYEVIFDYTHAPQAAGK